MHVLNKKSIVNISITITIVVVFSLILLPTVIILFFCDSNVNTENIYGSVGPGQLVTVFRGKTGTVEQLELEEYVRGVVSGEMPATFEMEALKAQAVAARTYAMSKVIRSASGNPDAHPNAPLCDDVHCQVYRTEDDLLELKGQEWMEEGFEKIKRAVLETQGQVMYYQGELVEQPLFHSSSGGYTENSEDVFVTALPYLRSVESKYEDEATHKDDEVIMTLSSFVSKIKSSYPNADLTGATSGKVEILSHSEGGKVDEIKIGNAILTGRNIRETLGLAASSFSFEIKNQEIIIYSSGYGHGVGMSQWGANGMAQNQYSYLEILKHYYSGIEVE